MILGGHAIGDVCGIPAIIHQNLLGTFPMLN